MQDLSETVATMDPIDLVYDLNEEMLGRYPKFVFILAFAILVGFFASFVAALMLIVYILEGDWWNSISMILVISVSIPASYFGYRQMQFLDDYRLLASVVNRGLSWDPMPDVPPGDTELDRLLKYLEGQDDRFNKLFEKYPEKLALDVDLAGQSKKTHRFDAYYKGVPRFRDFKVPFLDIYIRTIPEVSKENIDDFKNALEDVLEEGNNVYSVRFILLQTGKPSFSDEIIEYVNTNMVEYIRYLRDDGSDWISPIEIIAENPEGHYNIGSFYFG